MSSKRTFTVSEMLGKKAFSADDVTIGKITKIIDQSDSAHDDPNKLCDIEKDLFQIVVEIDHSIFSVLNESMEVLFSSQTLDIVVEEGIKLKLPKELISSYIEQSK
ncbi:MAG: hypothetical protein FK730_08425 [Asgard group archaeon]|nr:hypothetical protein [Asgard group archaeon]